MFSSFCLYYSSVYVYVQISAKTLLGKCAIINYLDWCCQSKFQLLFQPLNTYIIMKVLHLFY